jgi:hypothetical protein
MALFAAPCWLGVWICWDPLPGLVEFTRILMALFVVAGASLTLLAPAYLYAGLHALITGREAKLQAFLRVLERVGWDSESRDSA